MGVTYIQEQTRINIPTDERGLDKYVVMYTMLCKTRLNKMSTLPLYFYPN